MKRSEGLRGISFAEVAPGEVVGTAFGLPIVRASTEKVATFKPHVQKFLLVIFDVDRDDDVFDLVFVSDDSRVADFAEAFPEGYDAESGAAYIASVLEVPVAPGDLVVEVAERLAARDAS